MLRSLFSKIWVKGQKIWRTKLNNKLFVKNISFRITEAELSELFASCGEVVSAFIAIPATFGPTTQYARAKGILNSANNVSNYESQQSTIQLIQQYAVLKP